MPYVLRDDPARSRKAADAVERIRARLGGTDVRKAILFGSAARGVMGRDSDLDLLLVRPTGKRFVDRAADLYPLLDCGMAMDLLVYTPEEFARLRVESLFVRWIVEEGKTIYEAEPGD